MSLPSPNICYYRDGKLCSLRVQAELRGLADGEPVTLKENCKCVFYPPVSDTLQDVGCPYFTGQITPQGIENVKLVGSREELEGVVLPEDSDLLILSKKYDSDSILFCFLQGFIHPSFCVHCTSYSGKFEAGNARKRLVRGFPSCTISTRSVGHISDGKLTFNPQHMVDGVLSEQGFSQSLEQNYYPVPFPEKLIKHEMRRDITLYDRFFYTHAFCFRCGPDNTKGIHFHCKKCGTRRLCNNCIQDYKEETTEQEGLLAHFTCPDCGHKNEIGIGGRSATRYSLSDSHAPHEQPDNPVWPSDYQVLADRLINWTNFEEGYNAQTYPDNIVPETILASHVVNDYEWLFRPLPSPEAMPISIEKGLLKGVYFIDHKAKKSWRLRNKAKWRDDIIRRSPDSQKIFKYAFDAIISFKSEEIKLAQAIAHKLLQRGYYVYILQSAQNQDDGLWDMRYSTALFRSKIFIPLFTETFMKGEFRQFTIDEVAEASLIEQLRNQLLETEHVYIKPLIGNSYLKSEETEKYLKGHTLLLQSDGLDEAVNQLAKAIELAPDEAILSTKIPKEEDFISKSNLKEIAKTELCMRCHQPVVFDPTANTSYEGRNGRGIAFVCYDGHRFCTNCDARKQGGMRQTCSECAKTGEIVGGDRVPKDFYYSEDKHYFSYKAAPKISSVPLPVSFRKIRFDEKDFGLCSFCMREPDEGSIVAKQDSVYPRICIDCTKHFSHNFPEIDFSFPAKIMVFEPISKHIDKTPHDYVIKDTPDKRFSYQKCGFCKCDISPKNPLYSMRKRNHTSHICKNCLKSALDIFTR